MLERKTNGLREERQGRTGWRQQGQAAVIDGVTRAGLSKKVTFELRPV